MQTFAQVRELLLRAHTAVRDDGTIVTVRVAAHDIEACRVLVGAAEWIVLSVRVPGPTMPRAVGLGAVVSCPSGWALRSTLPVAEVSARTIDETTARLAYEASLIARATPHMSSSLAAMWAD